MRVGILTFHTVLNYGALLQAYALQTEVKRLGHRCEIIDYNSDYFKSLYKPVTCKDLKHPKGFFRKVRMIKSNRKLHLERTAFSDEFLCLSEEQYTRDSISRCQNRYDVIIVGSDQVWSFAVNGNDKTYFLDFVNDDKKCVSYAASVSMSNLTEEQEQLLCSLLKRFKAISVREEEAGALLEKVLGKEISVDLDPTLLTEKTTWFDLSDESNSEEYILLYMMSFNREMLDYSIELGKQKGIPVKYINLFDTKLEGTEMIYAPSVREWVSLFRNARYVVTNSFHGTAFSVIFEKQFVYGMGKNKGKNTRLSTLMKSFGIENRTMNLEDFSNMDEKIDYDLVNCKLKLLREKSIQHLTNSIEE